MAKFSCSLLFALGALVTLTLGQDQTNPLAFLLNPDTYSPVKECPVACAAECSAMQMTCVDIPDLIDCAALNGVCSDQCDQLCGCMSDCEAQCLVDYPCDKNVDSAIMEIQCHSKRLVCSSACETTCPETMEVQAVQSAINQAVTAMTK